jgi:hypothetical protein
MAKTPGALYKGSLKLDKVKGLRADKVVKQTVPFSKKATPKLAPNRSMKTTENTFRGKKY